MNRVWSGWRFLILAGLLALVSGQARAADEGVEARLRRDVTFLASDECEGRGVSTKGINLAADYIAAEFKKAGLKPGGPNGSYFQPFTMAGGNAKLQSPNTVRLQGPKGQENDLRLDDDFEVLGMAGSGKVSAPVVFVGYGISAENVGYDDYKGVDVAGKVVLMIRKTPRVNDPHSPFEGGPQSTYAALATKLSNAELHEAAAVLFVSDRETAGSEDRLMSFDYTAADPSPSSLPAVHIHREVADNLLRSALGVGLRDLEKEIDENLKPHSVALAGWKADLDLHVHHPRLDVKNIVGVLEGKGPLANQTVVVGAHYDHLGYGGPHSLARDPRKPQIHHGADDNASGSAALMEVARHFAAMSDREGRRLVFLAFSGEESGLLGSAYYVKHPLYPLADTVAMVNLDMVGRMIQDKQTGKDRLLVEGSGTGKNFDALLDRLNAQYDFKMVRDPGGMGPSDQASFYPQHIPVLFYWTGDHADYHRPSDTSDKINYAGMKRVVDITEDTVSYLAEEAERPVYAKVASKFGGNFGAVPRIGFRPSYSDEGEGVLMEVVNEGGPAAKAGLKDGDRIVEIGGRPVKNIGAYMTLLRGLKKGQPLDLGVLREGKKLTVQVTPE